MTVRLCFSVDCNGAIASLAQAEREATVVVTATRESRLTYTQAMVAVLRADSSLAGRYRDAPGEVS